MDLQFSAWVSKLEKVQRPDPLPAFSPDSLRLSLNQLKVDPADADEVIHAMPSLSRDPEPWSLLERSHHLLAQGLVTRAKNAEPLPPLPASLRFFPVHLILVTLGAIRQCHHELGIPDDVSWETLSHLGRAMSAYRAEHGEAGVHLTRWDWMRYFGLLYQVGRLTAIPYRLRSHPEAGPLFWYSDEEAARRGPGFRKGDVALSVHIPPTDPLTPEACADSFRRMETAFDRYFPGEPPQIATCTSWLLDEQLAEYLRPDSNIVAFQRLFEPVPGARDDDTSFLAWIFGPNHARDLDALPQRTTLERAAVTHVKNGRHWRMRTGWRKV